MIAKGVIPTHILLNRIDFAPASSQFTLILHHDNDSLQLYIRPWLLFLRDQCARRSNARFFSNHLHQHFT